VTTPAQDVGAATPPSRRRIVGCNVALSGFAAGALLGVFAFCWGFLADPLLLRRVPVSELVQVEHHEGLRLRVVSGQRIGSVAYGASLAGSLLHYPRSVRAARRIEAAIGGLPETGGTPTWRPDTVTSQPRVRAYLATLGVNAVLVLGTVVLNAVWPAA
jgi:hypothetical protein